MNITDSKIKKVVEFIHLVLTLFIVLWLNVNEFVFGNISMIIKLGVTGLWFVIAFLNREYLHKLISKSICLLLFILLLLIADKNQITNSYIPNFIYVFVIFAIYLYYSQEHLKKSRKIILAVLILDIIYIGINSFIALQQDPMIARFISTSAETQELLNIKGKYSNIGSYGYFYALAMFAVVQTYIAFNNRTLNLNKKTAFLNIALLVFNTILIVKAQFTISILLLISCSLLIQVLLRMKNVNTFPIILIVLVVLFTIVGFVLIENIVLPFLPDEVNVRLNEISMWLNGKNLGGTDLNSRFNLYGESLKSFIRSPIYGAFGSTEGIGRHSALLDLLAMFGILSILIWTFYIKVLKDVKDFLSKEQRITVNIVYLFFLILSTINTSIFSNIAMMLIIIIPFLLDCFRKELPNHESSMDS